MIFSFFPAIFWLLIYRSQDREEKEPWRLIILLWLAGMLLAFMLLTISNFIGDPFQNLYFTVRQGLPPLWLGLIILVIIEESLKFILLIALIWRNKEFNQIIDSVQYGVALSLGFAAIENIIYFLPLAFTSLQFPLTGTNLTFFYLFFIGRALFTTLLHSLTGGIMGLMIGKARFSKGHLIYLLIVSGVLLSIIIHLIFNISVLMNNLVSSIILAVVVSWYFFYHLRDRANLLLRHY